MWFQSGNRYFVVCCHERESCLLRCQPNGNTTHTGAILSTMSRYFYLSSSLGSLFSSFSSLLDCRPPPRRAVARARSLFRDSCSSARSIAPRSRKTNPTSPSVASARSWVNCGGRSPTRRRKSTRPGRVKKTNYRG